MKALLLDLDNTLVDRDAAIVEWLRTVLPARADMSDLVLRDRGGYGNRPAFLEAVARACGGSVESVRRRFTQELPTFVRLKRDADAMLRGFTGTTVVITNGGSPMQRGKLANAGLEGRIDHVLVSEECGLRKPTAAIFQRALELAGCAPEEALMIGDHPEVDIEGARAAGIDGVLVRTRWFDAPPQMRSVRTLEEVTW